MADPNDSTSVLQTGLRERGCRVGLRGKPRFIQDELHHQEFCEVSLFVGKWCVGIDGRSAFLLARKTCSDYCNRSCTNAANDECVEVGSKGLKFLVRQAGQEGAKGKQHFFRNQIEVVEAEIEVVPDSVGAASSPQDTAIGLPELRR